MSEYQCPQEYSNVNEENTACGVCGSRKHYTKFDGYIRCLWCDSVIDETVSK